MKKILILGAGVYQVPLIKAAKRMGIYTIVTSIKGNYPGFPLADKIYYEDITNYDAIVKIAQEEKIDGIATTGADVGVPTIGMVCDQLGLKGLSFESSKISSNKAFMKEVFEKNEVRSAKYRIVDIEDNDYIEKIQDLSFPLIFKAVDSSGSRGITRVNNKDEFASARQSVLNNTKTNYFVVEEFIEGEEFGAQAFVQDGKIEFILPHGDYVFTGDTGVPIGHFAPYAISKETIDDAKQNLELAVKAMKLDNCAINADFILKDGKTYVLEIGGRSGATCLAELVSIYFGYDYYEKIIQVALGVHADFNSTLCIPNASKLLMSSKDGIIIHQNDNNLKTIDGMYSDDRLVDVQFDYMIGDRVKQFRIGPDRIGHVITKGSSVADAVEALEAAISNIQVDVK